MNNNCCCQEYNKQINDFLYTRVYLFKVNKFQKRSYRLAFNE